jgi:hypothetical protein
MEGRLALARADAGGRNNYYYNSFSVTPRAEGRHLGVYLPVGYNGLTGFNAGSAVRAGALFFGSGSIVSGLVGTSKQADFYFRIHISGLHRK